MSFSFGFDFAAETENEGSTAPKLPNVEEPQNSEEATNGHGRCHAASENAIDGSDLKWIDILGYIETLSGKDLRQETIPLHVHSSVSVPLIEPLKKVMLSPSSNTSTERTNSGTSTEKEKEMETKSLIVSENTDIIEGVYEGGLKVWECSIDLCKYLAEQISQLRSEGGVPLHASGAGADSNDCRGALSGKGSVFEIGCGHGLPGCLVYRESIIEQKRGNRQGGVNEASTVLFSDYNEFVLRDVTLPNVFLNVAEVLNEEEIQKTLHSDQGFLGVSMVSGDWMSLSSQLTQGSVSGANGNGFGTNTNSIPPRFDLILAAETTYTYESTRDTAMLLARHLKYDTGVGLIATKRYYFGVGGGADAFRKVAKCAFLEEESCWDSPDATKRRLTVETIREFDNGSGNIRELLRVRLIKVTN